MLANLESYFPGTRTKSWLFTIMRHAFHNRIRVYEREKPGAADSVSGGLSHRASQDAILDCRETLSAIRALPLDLKEVVVLVVFMGMSYHEASEVCRCRLGTVQSRLFRARARLKENTAAAA